MYYALLTALCWSLGGFSSSRISRTFGAAAANGLRLFCASSILLPVCMIWGTGLKLPGFQWFILSGLLHLSLGDIGLYAVYRRLGPRIGVLMVASIAPAVALLGDWILLDRKLDPPQLLLIGGILLMVILAVAPKERNHLTPRELRVGIFAGIFSAVMQGLSAVVTGYGFSQYPEASSWSATFFRVSAGAGGVWLWMLFLYLCGKNPLHRPDELLPDKRVNGHPIFWLTLSTLMGPVIGMAFLMRAFLDTPSGLVQAVIAILPVLMIPVAWIFDGTIPSLRSVICGACAVVGTVQLALISG